VVIREKISDFGHKKRSGQQLIAGGRYGVFAGIWYNLFKQDIKTKEVDHV